MFPGYVLIHMIMNDDTWYVVRNTRGVTGFVGPGSKPVPLDGRGDGESWNQAGEHVIVDFAGRRYCYRYSAEHGKALWVLIQTINEQKTESDNQCRAVWP